MNTETIEPSFKDAEEKNLLVILIILGIFFSIIPFIIAEFGLQDKFSPSSRAINKALLNFEVVVFIVFVLSGSLFFLPFAWIISPCLFVINLIVLYNILSAISNNKPVNIPVPIKLFS